MTDRIQRLRDRSLMAHPRLSGERAQLITSFYKSQESQGLSVPVKRASAFKYILLNKQIWIGKDELIVGERGPEPAAVRLTRARTG